MTGSSSGRKIVGDSSQGINNRFKEKLTFKLDLKSPS